LRFTRLLRLARAGRITKVFHAVPELLIMAKCIVSASRTVFVTSFFVVIIVYAFAVFFVLIGDVDDQIQRQGFHNIPQAMNTLISEAVFPDQKSFLDGVLTGGVLYYVLSIFYFVMVNLTVLNMLIGVLCDQIKKVSEVENYALAVREVHDVLNEAFNSACVPSLDECRDDMTKEDLACFKEHLMCNTDIVLKLHGAGVDIIKFFDFLDNFVERNGEGSSRESFFKQIYDLLDGDSEAERQAVVHDLHHRRLRSSKPSLRTNPSRVLTPRQSSRRTLSDSPEPLRDH